MRVAHLILGRCNPDSANGVDKTVYYLSSRQAALGAEVAVFSLTAKEPLPVPGAEVRTFPPPSGKLGRLWPVVPGRLLEEVLGWGPDLVHFHSVHIGLFIELRTALRGNLARLREQVRRLGVEEQVVFAGPAFGEEKWAYLAGADAFVHPRRWEGFSFSVLEALAMGKTVLVSRAADPNGEIGAFGAGVVVEPRVPELSEGLARLWGASSWELDRMGRRARALVEERYGWRAIVVQLMEAYRREGLGAS